MNLNGNAVVIGNGTFLESIVIDVSIDLVGSGAGRTFIYNREDTDVITLSADGCTISGLTATCRIIEQGGG